MKITVFTSNNPRHLSLIDSLSDIADTVYAVQEANTVFPGKTGNGCDDDSVMARYFSKMLSAENTVFGNIRFSGKGNVHRLILRSGDLNGVSENILAPALESDLYIVFGASWIRGWLIDFLIVHRAVNIHMGVSPFYRGSACNFWAVYDGHPELVGATIHLLAKGLDSGDILYHALPQPERLDPFVLGMRAVKVAQDSLVQKIQYKELLGMTTVSQDKERQIRYSRGAEFTEEIAESYLNSLMSPETVMKKMENRELGIFTNPCVL